MKSLRCVHLSCLKLLFIIAVWIPDVTAQGRVDAFYISPTGNDHWSGTLADAKEDGTDGPFATLDCAREAAQRSYRSGRVPTGGLSLYYRGGVYSLLRTLTFTAEDSGTEEAPLGLRAFPGEDVILIGGKAIAGFGPVRDPAVLRRIDARYRDKILCVDLKAQGILEYGEISQRGSPGMELFFNGKRMTLARWPNSGWLRIADVPQSGEKLLNQGLEREKRFDGVPVGRHYGRITYDGDRPKRWSTENEIYLHGFWTWDWSDSYQKIKSIDTTSREISLQEPHHHYGYTKNQRYYVLNVLEELDTPGEWFLDRKGGILYFWPPAPIGEHTAYVSMLDTPLLSLENAAHVTVQGIHFAFSRGQGVRIRGGSHILIAGCTLYNLGGDAVVIDGGTHNGISGCDIFDVALGGVRVNGGDRPSLVPGGNYATNNHIHDYSVWMRTGQYAIYLDGVGNRLDHNLIHDAPFEAVYLRGNEHLMEFNEIHHVTQETGDAGAIHTGRDWTWRGNMIRYNYFHDLRGPGLHGVVAVYLDDWASGFMVYGNLFSRAGRGVEIGGGRDNTVENNVFFECSPSVHVDARGLGWASYYFEGPNQYLVQEMEKMHCTEPPYSERYPELLTLYNDEPAVPKNNKIVRNVSYGGRWIDQYDYYAYDFSIVTMRDNVIADSVLCRRRQKGGKGWDPYYLDIDMKEGYVAYRYGDREILDEFQHNVILNVDPGFVDPVNNDYRLQKDSPAFKLGFTPIPIDRIGPYRDEYRIHMPEKKR